jgi:FAD/FMN-containing dehydrogenase
LHEIKQQLQQLLEGEITNDPAALDTYSRDASIFQVRPELIISPKHTADIKKLVQFVAKHKHNKHKGLSITPRAAGTDMSGGPLSDSIILDMKPHFHEILKVGADFMTVQPGIYYRDFEKTSLKHHLILPSYTASKELCTIGGMIANNAAGELSLSYGQTERYVKKLKVVLADGNEYSLHPLNKRQLADKLKLKTYEGEIYRRVFHLVEKHQQVIQAAKPQVSKNSAGYLLWNVWDGKTFDLAQLMVGSQGTLGVITEATMELVRPKKHSRLLVIFLSDLKDLATIVNKVLVHKPESFECYDDQTLGLAFKFLPEIAKLLKIKNLFTLARQFLPELRLIVTSGMPKLVLLAQFTGDSARDVTKQAETAQRDIASFAQQTIITDKHDSKKYWVVRRESFNLLRHHVHHKHTAPFIDDIIVNPVYLPHFLPRLDAIMDDYHLTYTIAGHIGNGNFHIFPLMDMTDPATRKIIPELSERVFRLVLEYKGSIAGEHNDGIVRTPYLKMQYGPKICALFEEVKDIFDPYRIFNPGKKVEITKRYALDHFIDT